MDPRTFDGMIQKLSASLSRRKVVGGSVGAAVLTAVGLSDETAAQRKQNEVQAEGCISTGKKCPAKRLRGRTGKRRAKKLGCNRCCQDAVETRTNNKGKKVNYCACRPDGADCGNKGRAACCSGICNAAGKCAATSGSELSEQGNGTLTLRGGLQGLEACVEANSCTYDATGVITAGTPINAGTFAGSLTASNREDVSGGFTGDFAGTLTLTESATDTLVVSFTGTFEADSGLPGDFNATGAYTILSGTGRFQGATGSGTATLSGIKEDMFATVVALESLVLTGTIILA